MQLRVPAIGVVTGHGPSRQDEHREQARHHRRPQAIARRRPQHRGRPAAAEQRQALPHEWSGSQREQRHVALGQRGQIGEPDEDREPGQIEPRALLFGSPAVARLTWLAGLALLLPAMLRPASAVPRSTQERGDERGDPHDGHEVSP